MAPVLVDLRLSRSATYAISMCESDPNLFVAMTQVISLREAATISLCRGGSVPPVKRIQSERRISRLNGIEGIPPPATHCGTIAAQGFSNNPEPHY